VQLDASEILHRMHKLGVVGSVLYVAAHPDDENTRLISYLSNGRKVRTAYLSLTRGDGGQNLIGPELGDALGIIRTQELLEARRIDGGEQFFTRAVDFGYSKSAEETFAKWGHDEVLADVVRVIRTFRPDVIITRFAPDSSGGHGHHTASSILANEAFEVAADPKAFPDAGAPWQARRLFFNASTWWRKDIADVAAKDPETWLQFDVGGYDPLLGASYTEIAARSRSQHKSQGFGTAETRGEQLEYLQLQKGEKLSKPDMFAGIDIGWTRVERGDAIPSALRALIDGYDARAPEKSVQPLIAIVQRLDGLAISGSAERSWAAYQHGVAKDLLLQLCGIVVEATSKHPRFSGLASGVFAPKMESLSVIQRNPGVQVELVGMRLADGYVTKLERLVPNRETQLEIPLSLRSTAELEMRPGSPPSPAFDQPYWLAQPHDTLYHPTPGRYAGIEPTVPGAIYAVCDLRIEDTITIGVGRAVMNKWTDRVAGERMRQVLYTPAASIEIPENIALVRGDRASVTVEVEALTDDLGGTLSASLPEGWTLASQPAAIEHLALGERRALRLDIVRSPQAARGLMHLTFTGPNGATNLTQHVIDYPHILPQTWYTPADVHLVPLDVEVSVKTVGYIDGAGDDMPQALEQLGVVVQHIDPESARATDLAECDAIVVGIRAYNTKRALARIQPTLLAWVEQGGTLLVQYNTNGNDLVMDAKRIGPYPFSISRQRVTVEEAPAAFLAPKHALMNVPNELGPADFEGWVQERGLYFASELDPKYTALIAWNDPGEKPLDGGLIACDYGKGRFVYTGISLFRQLPAGVAGSYRLLANLIARRNGSE
jgi:LmbE family N-acetylglucosaminyl deacetylase